MIGAPQVPPQAVRPALRRGAVTVQFAVLMFALIPLAALLLHSALVLTTRRQMQTAVNASAREGLRFRDQLPDLPALVRLLDDPDACPDRNDLNVVKESLRTEPECDCAPGDEACLRDYVRRKLARRQTALIFDDDLDPSDDSLRFGVGPAIDFSGGRALAGTDFLAGRQADVGAPYKPRPRLNLSDLPHGDLVSGSYQPDESHREGDDYVRDDFTPGDDAFLARLRRSDDLRGLDDVAGVSSHGPPTPFLFGRGAAGRAIDDADPAAIWNQRERGTVVRATGIAQARRAKSVGPPYPRALYPGSPEFGGAPGRTPFALPTSVWASLVDGAPVDVDLDADGVLLQTTALAAPLGASATSLVVVGSSFVPPAVPFRIRIDNEAGACELLRVTAVAGTNWTVERGVERTSAVAHAVDSPLSVLQPLSIGADVDALDGPPIDAFQRLVVHAGQMVYAPLFTTVGGRRVVVAFGKIEPSWSWNAATNVVTIVRTPTGAAGLYVAPVNAAATFQGSAALPSGVAWSSLAAAHEAVSPALAAPAQVPALK